MMNRVISSVILALLVLVGSSISWAQTSRPVAAQQQNRTVTVIDSQDNSVGVNVSAAFINGYPAVVYSDLKTRKLLFAIAQDRLGTQWDRPVEISALPDTGIWCSLAEVNDHPAVAYYQQEVNSSRAVLIFRRALDRRGQNWGASNAGVIVHRGPRTGKMVQLLCVANNPALVWYSDKRPTRGLWRPRGAVYYTRATDLNGQTWSQPIMINRSGDAGQYPSIALVAGRPAVAFFDESHSGLKFALARDQFGYSWNRPKLISFRVGEIQGEYPSLAVVDGNPAIAFYHRTHNALAYMRARDCFGNRWERARFIDRDNVCGVYPQLIMYNDHPQVVYYARRLGSERGEIRHASALDSTGLRWSSPVTVNTLIELPAPIAGLYNKSFAGVGKSALIPLGNKLIVVSRTANNLSAFTLTK